MRPIAANHWRELDVAIIGGGIGGMSAATALRRAGHRVSIYEQGSFVDEAGGSISCAANGTRWLHEWDVDIDKGDGVILRKLISRDWTTGEPLSVYDLGDYEERWGYVHYMFQRRHMHSMLKDSALGAGKGVPAKLYLGYKCSNINRNTGLLEFENGEVATHDLIVGADGIGSTVRTQIGMYCEKRPAETSCLHANVLTEEAVSAGLTDFSQDSALQFWGGQSTGWDKIVLSPCQGGKLLSYYCFFPREQGDFVNHTWGEKSRSVEELLKPYPTLDPQIRGHLALGKDIQPWRLWMHEPYEYITNGVVCLLGDAAHPMMPHQSQGACMAIEDAAALGILFNKDYFRGDVTEALSIYEAVRLPRASKVQAAAEKAGYNINERIGFSSNVGNSTYHVMDEKIKLTIEEMNGYNMYKDIDERIAGRAGQRYTKNFSRGLPFGLKLSNGVTIGVAN